MNKLWFCALGIMLVLSSCTLEKRRYDSGYHIDWKNERTSSIPRDSIVLNYIVQNDAELSNLGKLDSDFVKIEESQQTIEIDRSIASNIEISAPLIVGSSVKDIFLVKNKSDECDIIILGTGEEVSAKVIEIGKEQIRYKKCENLSGPDYVINKSEVFIIKYFDGSKDIITPRNSGSSRINENERKTQGFAVAGFVLSILGLIVAGIPLGILAMIFGSIGLGKISREPKRFKGRGLAIASIIIGAIAIIAAVIFIAFIL